MLKAMALGLGGVLAAPFLPAHAVRAAEARTLVVYFSRTGVTRQAAERLRGMLNCAVVPIIPAIAYPQSFGPTAERATREQLSDARPEISVDRAAIAASERIVVGYPIWLTKMPMVMLTFFGGSDFSGKTILPFCTYERTGLGQTVDDIRTLCPDATVAEGLALPGGDVAKVETDSARDRMESWLRENGWAG